MNVKKRELCGFTYARRRFNKDSLCETRQFYPAITKGHQAKLTQELRPLCTLEHPDLSYITMLAGLFLRKRSLSPEAAKCMSRIRNAAPQL